MDAIALKKRAGHEIGELLTVLMILAPFLVSFAIFRQYVEGTCGTQPFSYATALAAALINALVLAKVILIGEMAKVGKSSESKPLLIPTLHKAAVFTVVYLIVHLLENAVRSLFHGQTLAGAMRSVIIPGELMALSLVVFFAFIPFFGLRELRRVVGAAEFRSLFLGGGTKIQRPPGPLLRQEKKQRS